MSKMTGPILTSTWITTWFLAIWINQYRIQLLLTGGIALLLALLVALGEIAEESQSLSEKAKKDA